VLKTQICVTRPQCVKKHKMGVTCSSHDGNAKCLWSFALITCVEEAIS
jgi:hypothetical protein